MENLAIAVDLGGTHIRGAVVNEKRGFLHEVNELTPAGENRETVLNKIFFIIDRLMQKAESKILGIGIGTPGIVDPATGGIIGASPNIADWPGTPLRRILEGRYHLPVEVCNDVNAITLGEFYFGDYKTGGDFACLALGTGVGIGIILDGFLFAKAHELGHTVVNFNGPQCSCGRYGCVEAYTSGTWIFKHYQNLKKGNFPSGDGNNNAKIVFDRYQSGDTEAQEVINNFISALSSVMANIILSFSIPNFIIAGGVSQSLPLFQERLFQEVQKRSISRLNGQIKIYQERLGNRAGILGVASLLFKKIPRGCKEPE